MCVWTAFVAVSSVNFSSTLAGTGETKFPLSGVGTTLQAIELGSNFTHILLVQIVHSFQHFAGTGFHHFLCTVELGSTISSVQC